MRPGCSSVGTTNSSPRSRALKKRASSYRKATLVADDKEWEKLKEQLWCFVVKDAGLTEVDPGTETVMALWPMRKSEVPKLVKRLQTLKGDPIFRPIDPRPV